MCFVVLQEVLMYTPIWNGIRKHLSAERMQADIAEFFEFSRWSSFDKINGLAQCIAAKMEALGMEDARLISFPADGRTSYGGWRMPRAYDVQTARLTLLRNDGNPEEVLADYQSNPVGLMLYSLPTPTEGIVAELIVADKPEELTPARVAGKLVLTSGIGVEISRAAMGAGAVGLVSDCRNAHRIFKNGPDVDQTNEWHNYTIPPGDEPNKGFGFSLSPQQGRRLREMLAAGQIVRLHALVQTRHYDGILPVVSGRLPGTSMEEIVLTGHYDEFGADDNCSQIAVSLEVCRAIQAMLLSGEIAPLKRSVRVLLPMEVRGFNALIQNPDETRHIRAGLNIDTVGTDQNLVTSTCTLSDNFAALLSYAEDFAAELLARTGEENPLFRWRRTDAEMIDNIFGEPLIGAPTPAIWHFSATHHLATDTPDKISGRMLLDMARVAGTYAAFLANAALPEACWLAELVGEQAGRRMNDIAAKSLRQNGGGTETASWYRQLASGYEQATKKLRSPLSLVPAIAFVPCAELADAHKDDLIGLARLLPQEYFQERIDAIQTQLAHVRGETEARLRRHIEAFSLALPSAEDAPIPVSRCVPLKTFRGFVAFEDVSEQERETVCKALDISGGWGAPGWVQDALMFANGKRTAGEIARLLYRHTRAKVGMARLERLFAFMAERGIVRLRPYLTQPDIKAALEQAGLAKGDVVLGHFALSRFGYIEGGADALIEILLNLLGPEGTLVMPTFTFSWIGRLPYDFRTTPSRVGAVTNHFWQRSGVLRSLHPTHSFAAIGKHADALLAGHDHKSSPLSQDGPLGRLADWNGKVLLFSPPATNTILHVGEYQAGLPLMDYVCPIVENGERKEVIVPDCPWHVRFAPAYEKLAARGQMQEVALGEETLRVMRCRDAIRAQADVMRETPRALLQPGCDCPYCQKLEAHCREIQEG